MRYKEKKLREERQEHEHIELRELENSHTVNRDWYKGSSGGKHLYRTEHVDPVDLERKMK